MGLKLFRSTGYSSILMAGETRLAMHPGWMVLAVSLWNGFVANVALWRAIGGSGQNSLGYAVTVGVGVAGACAIVLSLLGWRKTLKPVAVVLLVLAALAASSIWSQALPVDGTLLDRHPASVFLPPWAGLLRWQVSAALAGLALVPGIWLWQKRLRRLAAGEQLRLAATGLVLGIAAVAASQMLLSRGG